MLKCKIVSITEKWPILVRVNTKLGFINDAKHWNKKYMYVHIAGNIPDRQKGAFTDISLLFFFFLIVLEFWRR